MMRSLQYTKYIYQLLAVIILVATTGELISQEKLDAEIKAAKAYEEKQREEAIKLWQEARQSYNEQNRIEDEIRVVKEIGKTYMHLFKIDSAQHYYTLSRDIAKANNKEMAYLGALNSLSAIYVFKSEQDSAVATAKEILSLPYAPPDHVSDAHSTLSTIYESRFEYDKAKENIKAAIALDSMRQDSSSLPFNYTTLARLKSREAKNDEAIELLLRSIEYLRGDRDKFKYASIYYEISKTFFSLNNFYKSREYAQRSLEICEEMNLKTTKIDALVMMALNEEREGNYEKALKYYFEAEDISINKNKKRSLITINLGIAACYLELDELKFVKERIDQTTELIAKSTNTSLKLKFEYIKHMYNYKSGAAGSISQLESTYKKAQESKSLYMAKSLSGVISKAYQNSNPKKAYAYITDYNSLKDSIYVLQQSLMAQELEAKYQKQEQESQIELLAAENNLKSNRLKQQNMLIWGTCITLGLFAILLFIIFRFYRSLKQQKSIVEKSLNEKNVLLREIHHRVKNNLQVISSLLALQSRYIEDDNALTALQQGQDRVHSMALIHEDLYRSENLKGVDTEIYFEQLIDNLFESYNIHEDRVELKMDVEPISLDVDTMIPLGLILNELVSNSLKHAFKGDRKGVINISLKEKNKALHLNVKDNGSDISSTDEIDGKSFGFELVKAFARKLKAEMEIYIDNGLAINMIIKQYEKAA